MSFDVLGDNRILEQFGLKTKKIKLTNPRRRGGSTLTNPFTIGFDPTQSRRVKNPIRRTRYKVVSVNGSRDFTSVTQARAWARKQLRATRQPVNIFRST